MITMNAPVTPQQAAANTEEAIRRLDALGSDLERLGLRTRLDIVIDRPPSLHVQNPEPGAGALQEHIYAAPKGGQWTFWWSWAEPVAELPADAAAVIARALRSAG
jgi:hypothetical protein